MRRRLVLSFLLCLWPSLALGQTQSASTKDKEPSKQNGKPCVSKEAAQEVLRLGRSLGYPDDEIVEAYAEDSCATLSYLRQEGQQKAQSDSDYQKRYKEASGPTEKGKILAEYSERYPESFSKSVWAKTAVKVEVLRGLLALLLGLALLIGSKWIERIPVSNRLVSLRKAGRQVVKWFAIGFLATLIVPFLVGFVVGVGHGSGWYQIPLGTQKWLYDWSAWIVIVSLVLITSAKEAWKKRRRAAQLEQTGAKGVSVP